MHLYKTKVVWLALLFISTTVLAQEEKLSRAEKLVRDRERAAADGRWIYNDLQRGFAEANKSGKPMMVVLRCVPCEECVKLDDDLVDTDPDIQPMLDNFVCVRQVSTNGLDLSIFQYDTDQSFAIFFLNGDGTVYGRFGTRSHRTEWLTDVSLEGMAEAMRAAFVLHKGYPGNREQLAGKQGTEPDVTSPEQYPALRDKYTSRLKSGGELVKSCIHCHQIGDAQREFYWTSSEPVPDRVIFQYPHPKSLGMILDPTERATVREITQHSLADQAGFQVGDEIRLLNGQPIISMADVQWVLHNAPAEGTTIKANLVRGGEPTTVNWTLPKGWRELDDISWRVSSWGICRMVAGGMRFEQLNAEARRELGIADGKMALRVKSTGKYGAHATAHKRGFKVDDVVVEYDGRDDLNRETDLFAFALRQQQPKGTIAIKFLRNGRPRTIELPMQR